MEHVQAFIQDLETAPVWVQLWVNFMGLVLLLAIPFAKTRAEARWTLAALVFVFPFMIWLHAKFGFQRILGLPHVIFWTPLVIYFWRRRERWRVKETLGGKWILLAFTVMCISLAFDYTDVVRYFLGHRL